MINVIQSTISCLCSSTYVLEILILGFQFLVLLHQELHTFRLQRQLTLQLLYLLRVLKLFLFLSQLRC
jgi:hypothetical protein